jgi:CheY-specific phosphatase CheX
MANPTLQDVVQRFGLEPISESVARLTEMVAKQDANLEDLAAIVRGDKALTARLLRAANPHASKPEEYTIITVKEALFRNGLRGFFVLAMGEPIMKAVGKTFRAMLGAEKVGLVNANSIPPLVGEHTLGEVEFSGQTHGTVDLRMTRDSARTIAARLLGMETSASLLDPQEIQDAIGELVNIVAGNFSSNLRDAGFSCRLHPPRITTDSDFKLRVVEGGCSERMAFVLPGVTVFVDLSVNPWDQ